MQRNKEATIEIETAMSFSLQRYWKLKSAERLTPAAPYEEDHLWANWNPEVPSLLRSTCPIEDEPVSRSDKNPKE